MTENLTSRNKLGPKSTLIWRIVQGAVWLVGLTILFCLIFFPTLGIHLFWNILIPVAPALLVVSVGLWRNVCPLASTALLPSHLNFSKRKKLILKQSGNLNLIAVIALFLIVPLRHAFFDMSGMTTAILLVSAGILAFIMGSIYEWKSGWCSGLCPVHPVEKLYGLKSGIDLPNAHCGECHRCVTPCPDSTEGISPLSTQKRMTQKISGFLMVGAFPGFVWGWFQVPDVASVTSFNQLVSVYSYPILGLVATSLIYMIAKSFFDEKRLLPIFATTAVSCYYWFRIPALFGFGIFPEDGMLVDLSGAIPEWSIMAIVSVTTVFFFWWIVVRKSDKMSWVRKPAFASK